MKQIHCFFVVSFSNYMQCYQLMCFQIQIFLLLIQQVRLGYIFCYSMIIYQIKSIPRKRSEFTITLTELKLMAAAAIIGDNNNPKTGYNNPAATGTPKML